MHLAQRAHVLVLLTAVLGIAAIWSSEPGLGDLWRIPAALLLLGLAFESWLVPRLPLAAQVDVPERLFLGRPQAAAAVFVNDSTRSLELQYAPAAPPGIEAPARLRRVRAPARGRCRDELSLLPVRLGPQSWPALPARVLGPLRLAWWRRELRPGQHLVVAPDTLRTRVRPRGLGGGARPRRVAGAGAELHQLRAYIAGDPLARIDWKATARSGSLITREFSEDQHLDILVAIDAGRFSRVRSGPLTRFGRYANLASRLGEIVTMHDDRIGLVVYADRVLASCAPGRGVAGVMRLRRVLEQVAVQPAESDPTAAAVSMRALLRHRALIVLLTDLDDANIADQLGRAVRLLSPPHLVVVAGVLSAEIRALRVATARSWPDPWVALAAAEHETRAAGQRLLLQRLGTPVIAAPAELLEQQVFAQYEALRRSRRV
ncbi:MAG TPA: DUF58 domain-containing protein [Steroidobacteraceae bacterium]|jgi:uncharacterized protein (DUF58 family)|nr:DUF58 domain-containing protein [Steroidobacteraceae bacterium]